jgi:hypothetical protein
MQPIQELGWSQVVELLKAAPDDLRLSQRLAERCSSLTGQEISVDFTAKARVLWLGLSRGHALLKQAVEWDQPCIGGQQQSNQLDGVRGSLWRYVMAFSDWERAARSVIWDGTQQKWFKQSSFACLYDHSTMLVPPWPNREQVPANLKQWLGFSMDEQHPLPDFLALGDGQVDFIPWLLGESHQLHPWAVLACLRNVVAHGALSPTKAQQWDLAPVYDEGLVVLHTLFRRLLAAIVGAVEVIHG